mgnify:CR=1 FL=1
MSVRRKIHKAVDNTADTLDEAKHRVKAGAERGKREAARKRMTPGQKLASKTKETGHTVAADFDRAKRKVRNRL